MINILGIYCTLIRRKACVSTYSFDRLVVFEGLFFGHPILGLMILGLGLRELSLQIDSFLLLLNH